MSLVEFLVAIITQLADDLADRRTKNNILTFTGGHATVICIYSI